MRTKTIMLCTVALTLGACSNSGPRYTPRAEISQNNYTQENYTQDRMDKKSYKDYEHREACQNYRKPPRNYSDGCVSNMMKEEAVFIAAPKPKPQKPLLPIVHYYTVLFDHDQSNIRAGENQTLDKIRKEINTYNPRQVTVTGYADSSGAADYNQSLSRQREETVSQALSMRGIENRPIQHEARGEYDQAVKTADGVRNQQNRRVVVDFRR